MALTLDNIFDRNQTLNILTKLEFKRRLSNDTYEATWKTLQELIPYPILTSDAITSLNYSIPNDNYSFGAIRVPDCKLKLYSRNREFANENNPSSIFAGFTRHKSQIRISQGYKDGKTGTEIYGEVYRGFINEKSNNTKIDKDNLHELIQVEDMLMFLLTNYTFSQFTLTELTLNDFIFELMNNTEFTDFLTVSVPNINAGYDIQHIYQTYVEDSETKNAWAGQTQLLTVLQELSIGHSIFYQREGVFHYQPIQASSSVIRTFNKSKIIKFENTTDGKNKVFERLYWEDSDSDWESPVNTYNASRTVGTKAVRDTSDRDNMLGNIGTRTGSPKAGYKLEIPIYPTLYILDKIQVIVGEYFAGGGFILDQSILDVDVLTNPDGASSVDDSTFWMIIKISHNFRNCTTRLELQQVLET